MKIALKTIIKKHRKNVILVNDAVPEAVVISAVNIAGIIIKAIVFFILYSPSFLNSNN